MTARASQGLHPASPILPVRSLEASLRYYLDALGFALEWNHAGVASVTRDRCHLMLVEGDQGHPGSWVFVGAADVDALHEELRARGAVVRLPPTNYPWAKELHVFDPDRNVIRFGSDSEPGGVFGAWLDQEGRTWPSGKAGDG